MDKNENDKNENDKNENDKNEKLLNLMSKDFSYPSISNENF